MSHQHAARRHQRAGVHVGHEAQAVVHRQRRSRQRRSSLGLSAESRGREKRLPRGPRHVAQAVEVVRQQRDKDRAARPRHAHGADAASCSPASLSRLRACCLTAHSTSRCSRTGAARRCLNTRRGGPEERAGRDVRPRGRERGRRARERVRAFETPSPYNNARRERMRLIRCVRAASTRLQRRPSR